MKTINFDHNIGDTVFIKALEMPGIITELCYGHLGILYRVAFWNDGKREHEYLFAREITSAT